MVNLTTDPATEEIAEETIAELLSPYRQALDDKGIGPNLLARKRKQQLNAKSVKHIKIKGELAEDAKLPPGYKIISHGGMVVGDKGVTTFDDAVIEYKGNDWAIQTKATESLEKILGLHTETVKHVVDDLSEILTAIAGATRGLPNRTQRKIRE